MPFKIVKYSQQDPQWMNDPLGNSTETLKQFGCAVTSIAMHLSGWGYPETPGSLNEKLKQNGGFSGGSIRWGAVSTLYPQIKVRATSLLNGADAPLAEIDASLAAGQPVVVLIDYQPDEDLDWHYVLVYEKQGNDYMILDPWPLNEPKGVSLTQRFGHQRPLARAIFQVIFLTCSAEGNGTPVSTPSIPATPPTPPPPAVETNFFVYVQQMESPGLRLRSQPNTDPSSQTITFEAAGTQLRVIEAEGPARQKAGQMNQWLRVRDPQGREGYVAAWFIQLTAPPPPTSTTTPAPPPVDTASPAPIKRSRASVAEGLESVPLEAPADQRVNDAGLLARIWNRYGGLLAAIAEKLNFDPAIAVAILAQESGGQAYGADGRLIIRFENHLFYEYWGKKNPDVYNQFFKSGSPVWTGHQWRPTAEEAWRDCHTRQAVEWDVFEFACTLDNAAAKKSISMGLPQVLGSNSGLLGFASVHDMFNAFVSKERNQVIAFFDFLQGNGATAINALKTRDFRTIASIYNGAGQADYYGRQINNLYNTFVALRGVQPPITSKPTTPPATPTTPSTPPVTTPSTPTTPAPPPPVTVPTTPSTPAPPPSTPPPTTPSTPPSTTTTPPATPKPPTEPTGPIIPPDTIPSGPVETPAKPPLQVVVSAAAGAGGLRIRAQASTTAPLVVVAPTGSVLTVLDDEETARAKIGQQNKWLWVQDRKGLEGFVAAWFVEAYNPGAPATTGTTSTPTPLTLTVRVAANAGPGGINLRAQASQTSAVIKVLKVNTPLTVIEDLKTAGAKIGLQNQWLQVKDPAGATGYVAAWFVEK